MSVTAAVEPVLVKVGQHEFGVGDFEYIYHKNNLAGKQSLEKCLSLYIPYKLKIAAAKDAGLDTLPVVIDEWTRYRNQLAEKYIADEMVGEHLLRETYDRSHYEVKVAHILLKISDTDTMSAYNRIMQIRQKITTGEDFGQLAIRYSDDPSAKTNYGELGWFSVFQMAYPFEAAAYCLQIGQISMPVRTHAGYHLIRVTDRRPCKQLMSYEEAKTLIQQKIMNDDQISEGMGLVENLKTKNHFTENKILLENLFRGIRDTNSINQTLFSYAGQDFGLQDFDRYSLVVGQMRNLAFATVEQLYQQYVLKVLLDHESKRFESNLAEFRNISGEYFDGLLLFAISEQEVWSKALRDSSEAAGFYKKNTKMYRWKKRMDATVYYCSDKEVAVRVSQIVKNKNAGAGVLPEGLYTFFCNTGGIKPCIDTIRRTLPKGANTIADQFNWKKGCSKILEWNGKFVFLDVHDVFRPVRKTFREAYGEVIADYQDILEARWVKQLKERYPVTINEVVWADLKKKYAE